MRLQRIFQRPHGEAVLRGRPEERWRELIARLAPGRTFADVGCLWNVHGAYAFHALDCGATRVVGVDVAEPAPQFHAENARRQHAVEFVQGDVNDPDLPARIGTFDVVFCSGVLYHMPNPLLTLQRLRALCRERLLLTTARIAERDTPQCAVFLPHLDERTRRELQHWSPGTKVGLDTDFMAERGYGNWFWGLTPSAIRAMLRTTGLAVQEELLHRFVYTAICTPT